MIDKQKEQALFNGFRLHAGGHQAHNFHEMVRSVQADAETLAGAMMRASTQIGGSYWDAMRPSLESHLKLLLTQEHVAAQQRMSEAADNLAEASLKVATEAHKTARLSFWLTFASVVVALASLVSAVLIATGSA